MSNSNSTNSTASILKANIKKKSETKETAKSIDTQDHSSNQAEPISVKVKAATTQSADDVTVQSTELEDLKAQVDNWKTKALRFAADNQNILKQHELDNQQVIKRTKKVILTLLMPFLTSMNLAFAMMPSSEEATINKYIDGLKSQLDKVIGDLKNTQVDIIVPSQGEEFDPVTMTSLNSADDEVLTVKQIIGLGLRIDGQLIQAATVML